MSHLTSQFPFDATNLIELRSGLYKMATHSDANRKSSVCISSRFSPDSDKGKASRFFRPFGQSLRGAASRCRWTIVPLLRSPPRPQEPVPSMAKRWVVDIARLFFRCYVLCSLWKKPMVQCYRTDDWGTAGLTIAVGCIVCTLSGLLFAY